MTPFEHLVTTTKPTSVKPLKEGKTGALLVAYGTGQQAIMKPAREALPNGKTTQRGLPVHTQPLREAAFYALAKLLGLEELVPETVLLPPALGHEQRPTSVQIFTPAYRLKQLDPRLDDVHRSDWVHLLKRVALRVPRSYWRQLLMLDLLAGARDRHANNVGVTMRFEDETPTYRLIAWDNACTFGDSFDRYHNVFHKYLFRDAVQFDAQWPAWTALTLDALDETLAPFLRRVEIMQVWLRVQFFKDYPYRLPWRVLSRGHDHHDAFPAYASYFQPPVVTAGDARV